MEEWSYALVGLFEPRIWNHRRLLQYLSQDFPCQWRVIREYPIHPIRKDLPHRIRLVNRISMHTTFGAVSRLDQLCPDVFIGGVQGELGTEPHQLRVKDYPCRPWK